MCPKVFWKEFAVEVGCLESAPIANVISQRVELGLALA